MKSALVCIAILCAIDAVWYRGAHVAALERAVSEIYTRW